MDNDALYALIHKLQNDLTTKFDRLSEQVGDLRVVVLQAQATDQAHDLPSKVELLSGRLSSLEIRLAAERDLPAKVENHETRLKTVEKREDEREGRRKIFEWLVIIAGILGGLATAIQIYQVFKGR